MWHIFWFINLIYLIYLWYIIHDIWWYKIGILSSFQKSNIDFTHETFLPGSKRKGHETGGHLVSRRCEEDLATVRDVPFASVCLCLTSTFSVHLCQCEHCQLSYSAENYRENALSPIFHQWSTRWGLAFDSCAKRGARLRLGSADLKIWNVSGPGNATRRNRWKLWLEKFRQLNEV